MKFDFGKYDGWDVSDVVKKDRDYSKWILNRIKKKEKLKKLSAEIQRQLDEIPAKDIDPNIIRFGKYQGQKLSDFVYEDKSYSKWLLEKSNLQREAPETYEILERLYQVFHIDQKREFTHFYALSFKDRNYLKIGITSQFPLFRLYNYIGTMNFYLDHDIDFKNSFVYKTNDLQIESKILKEFKDYRVCNKTERMNLTLRTIEKHLIDERNKSQGKHFYHKKCVYDFFPFESGQQARNAFRLKVNEFNHFEENYKKHLERLGLLDQYKPEFYAMSEFLN